MQISPPMKDLSLFFIKNSLSAKMKKGLQTFCSDDSSTSTLTCRGDRFAGDCTGEDQTRHPPLQPRTLEEMIMQLEVEEAAARAELAGRKSCADHNTEVMTSARNALNQYPRFSLDGRDAMYRSSFRNFVDGRKSFCGSGGVRRLPTTVAGERVVWCKPGVVARLMGLEALPVPVGGFLSRRQKLRRMGRVELEKERTAVSLRGRRKGARGEEFHPSFLMDHDKEYPFGGTADWKFQRAR
ncbi:hypothetical protein AXF42_Ash010619 [Apostasia shenzhenica]|uniref:DUF3741 domain-containing protein n=1 Tax=Apostasia shenzhenica TaxID=1088818 RepID=A0A2I0A6L0_9ASPA|nr:hypothetical protein AXF42_Ash010619 [Apostasia shenzhenica]